jgi:hypothetical protein
MVFGVKLQQAHFKLEYQNKETCGAYTFGWKENLDFPF